MEPAAAPDEAFLPPRPMRVFILSDHSMVRQGLKDLLEHHGFEVVGESGSATEAACLIPMLHPDIALLDDRLPDGTGIEVCRGLRSTIPGVACLILTGWDHQHAVRAAVLAGATGYLLKQVGDTAELVNSIRLAAAGHPLIGSPMREQVAAKLHATASASWLDAMTRSERAVLALMAKGLTDPQIGGEMALPEDAVAGHVSSVLLKLGFRRRTQLLPAPIPRAWELLG
ncbi:response regulator [Paenarthrobacter sp. 22069]|uniref:response regulator n=1 Tax=Paenarthrobacter sp. 22069 TaxID=3453864 RepID=UPI003F87DAD4